MGRLVRSGGIPYANAGESAILAGTPVVVGSIFGVAAAQIAVGETGWLETTGVWELAKASATTADAGAVAYWDSSNSQVTGTASTNLPIGKFAIAAANGSTVATVLLGDTAKAAGSGS